MKKEYQVWLGDYTGYGSGVRERMWEHYEKKEDAEDFVKRIPKLGLEYEFAYIKEVLVLREPKA